MQTTLNEIRKHEPCTDGWKKLLTYLGKTEADDEQLSIATIIDSNGLQDALWCLRAVEGRDKEIRMFAVWCARQVQHLLTDKRSLAALDVAERFANGQTTKEELVAARAAARNAASAATRNAAWDAAWSAAGAAEAAAWGAAWGAADAAGAAADVADDAEAAAWGAAYAADAAGAAACAVADDAARYAANATAYAAMAADKDAGHEMKKKQEAELRRICGEG